MHADVDGRLGKTLKKDFGKVVKAVRALSSDAALDALDAGFVVVEGVRVDAADLKITRQFAGDAQRYEAAWDASGLGLLVILDLEPDEALVDDTYVREASNRVARARHRAGIETANSIDVLLRSADARLLALIDGRREELSFKGRLRVRPTPDAVTDAALEALVDDAVEDAGVVRLATEYVVIGEARVRLDLERTLPTTPAASTLSAGGRAALRQLDYDELMKQERTVIVVDGKKETAVRGKDYE